MDLIISDLDGTLLDGNHMCSDNTAFMLKQLKEKHGFYFAICTGRHLYSTKFVASKVLNITDYIATQNGSLIYDKEEKVVYDKKMPNSILKTVYERYYDSIEELITYDGDDAFCFIDYDNHVDSYSINGVKFSKGNVNTYKNDINKLLLIGNHNMLCTVQEDIKQNFDVECFFSRDTFLEIDASGAHKGNASKFLIDALKPDNVLMFGDNDNDIEMLSLKEYHSVCMKNGSKKAKLVAKEINKYANTEEGLVKYLEEYYL